MTQATGILEQPGKGSSSVVFCHISIADGQGNGVGLADTYKVIFNAGYGGGETEESDALRRAEVLISRVDRLLEIRMRELEEGAS